MRSSRQRDGKPSLSQDLAQFLTYHWTAQWNVISQCLELFETINEYGVPTRVKSLVSRTYLAVVQ